MFDPLRKALSSLLTSDYLDFKRTPDYDALSSVLSHSSSSLHHSDDRHVEPFEPAALQLFLLKVKGTKRSKEIKFPKKEALWTIGRDKSNKLVIEDSRVSRSHARVEYTDVGCEYIDLGSSCGFGSAHTSTQAHSTHATPHHSSLLNSVSLTQLCTPLCPLQVQAQWEAGVEGAVEGGRCD